MKVIKLIFLVFLISSLSISASALNLDVDNDLSDFANQNLLKNADSNNLINPFLVDLAETEAKEKLDLEDDDFIKQNKNLMEVERENLTEENDKQLLIINGVISASNKAALLINYQNTNHVLKIGDSINNLKLISYQNGDATFILNGSKTKISY